MTWPLIASCSVRVNDYSNAFKSEYIIPQLLLQWIRETHTVDAIKFNSTHIDTHKTKSTGDFSNLVLPVKKNREKGFCPDLQSMFEMTEAVSWQLFQDALGGQANEDAFSGGEPVNNRIGRLELIKGHVYPYSYSILGKLEQFLNTMKTLPI